MSRRRDSLSGLVRLRDVREQDSRIGLATALSEEQETTARIAELERQLATLPAPATLDIAAFRARQHTLEAIRIAMTQARADLEIAHVITAAARERWISDRSRLKAVESLVERRAAARRAERERRERIELDEVAQEMWRRGQAADAVDPAPVTVGGVA